MKYIFSLRGGNSNHSQYEVPPLGHSACSVPRLDLPVMEERRVLQPGEGNFSIYGGEVPAQPGSSQQLAA